MINIFLLFLYISRGLSPLPLLQHPQRPASALSWAVANATSYIDKNLGHGWAPTPTPASTSVTKIRENNKNIVLTHLINICFL